MRKIQPHGKQLTDQWVCYQYIHLFADPNTENPMGNNTRLNKELGLLDVFAISTGAMFSMAEISNALPLSGGAYYFLDRGLGSLCDLKRKWKMGRDSLTGQKGKSSSF
jgi:hypothetical protein